MKKRTVLFLAVWAIGNGIVTGWNLLRHQKPETDALTDEEIRMECKEIVGECSEFVREVDEFRVMALTAQIEVTKIALDCIEDLGACKASCPKAESTEE